MENGEPKSNPPVVNQQEPPTVNNSNPSSNNEGGGGGGGGDGGDGGNRRTRFTELSQVDADLALARTLQEQERAYMMIRMNGGDRGGYDGGWIDGSYELEDDDHEDFHDPSEEEDEGSHTHDEGEEEGDVEDEEEEEEEEDDEDEDEEEDDEDEEEEEEEEDAFDINAHDQEDDNGSQDFEIDPSAYSSDESYARALQEAEERQMAARLLAMTGISRMDIGESEDEEDLEDHGGNAQDVWEEVDPDELSYEELIALGEVVGTESRGLSANMIASLPSISYKSQGTQEGNMDSCVICRLDYEEDDTLTVLKCKHSYHSDCINHWLKINKVCPVCSAEVGNS